MARKKRRKKSKRSVPGLNSTKAKRSRAKGHKPVALLESWHRKMEKNLGKLEGIIRRRKAAGE
ncbi:MAG TPA: hypothetical protein VF077_09685 [Nitrospiraceae bacterium]